MRSARGRETVEGSKTQLVNWSFWYTLTPGSLHSNSHSRDGAFPRAETIPRLKQANIKTYLQPNNNRIQIQHRFPILPQYIQADVALQINVRVVDLLRTFHLRRVVREVLVDGEGEVEAPALVHAFVRADGQGKILDIVRVGEGGLHCGAEGELGEIYKPGVSLATLCW